MVWDINYEHTIGTIGQGEKKSDDKWELYRMFVSTQIKQQTQRHKLPGQLDNKEKKEVEKLREIDRKVRAHEMAHLVAGGPYVRGGPYYKYVTGPDGKRYAVAGEVKIDTSEEKDPEKTIQKMEIVKKAALAPADPSPTDRRVAAEAAAKEAKARAKLMEEKMKKFRESMKKHTSISAGEKSYVYNNLLASHNMVSSINASNNPPFVGGIDITL